MKLKKLATRMCLVCVPVAMAAVAIAPGGSAYAARSKTPRTLGPWQLTSTYSRSTSTSGQGLATLTAANGSASVVYRGSSSIPFRLLLQGWQHIGDPGAGRAAPGGTRNYLFDAYQGSASATSKMFEVTTPSGQTLDYVHPLASGEANNNSFAAISPDGQWMVSGEWGTMSRLLVFPTPLLNPAASQSNLTTAGQIGLDQTVSNLQGCDFLDSQSLLCTSDGTKQLLQINLEGTLGTGDVPGKVSVVGPLPLQSRCRGTYEAEGIDYYAPLRQMTLSVIPPGSCSSSTTFYVYRQ